MKVESNSGEGQNIITHTLAHILFPTLGTVNMLSHAPFRLQLSHRGIPQGQTMHDTHCTVLKTSLAWRAGTISDN
jgi:hypothetical protein